MKLLEAWKATHLLDYPIKLEKNEENLLPNLRELRPTSIRLWKETGKSSAARDSFSRSTANIWSQAPPTVKDSINLAQAKRAIREYCKMLPI